MTRQLSAGVDSVEVLESVSPTTGKKLGEVRIDTAREVAAAVARAREAQVEWAAADVDARNTTLSRLRGVLIDRAGEIASLVSAENGKPRSEAASLILPLCETVKFYTALAKKLERGERVSPTFFFGAKARVYYEPVGVAGYILPWNFPFELGVKHMIPALAGGNAVVQKPSEANPLIGELIASLFADAGVPNGLVQMIHGYAEVAQELIDRVDVVCFVGSPGTGRKIMERAARTLTPVVLELGGNDAAIVRADADLALTARGLVNGTCFNAGQVCNGIERVYVARALVEPLVARILAIVSRLRQDGSAPYDLGPVTWKRQVGVYEEHTADALAKGATLHCGGIKRELDGGVYWPPTVLTGMTHDMTMMNEETFGPFVPIMATDNDEQALSLANDSRYGLGGSIWTRDVTVGEAMARRLNAGSVMVNNAVLSGGCITLPFGGSGESGVGRVQGKQGYFNYVAPKSIMTCGKSAANMWMPYGDHAEALAVGLARLLHGRSLAERFTGAAQAVRNRPWG